MFHIRLCQQQPEISLNQRFEIASFLVLFGAILWFDPRREHSSIPTEGLGLDWPGARWHP
jgi:hypothetical protein